MKTEGERLRYVRKAEGLTLVKLGERIGLKNNTLSDLERGKRPISNITRKAICREFGIREEWLQYGTGQMRVEPSKHQELEDFFKDVELDSGFKNQLISVLARLDPAQWSLLEQIANELLAETQGSETEQRTPEPEINTDEFFELPEERQLEILRREKRKRMGTQDPISNTG